MMIPRPVAGGRGPAVSPARESQKPAPSGKAAPTEVTTKGAPALAKGLAKSAGAEGARHEASQAESTQVGAQALGREGMPDSLEGGEGRGRFELFQGEARSALPRPMARLSLLTTAPEAWSARVMRREEPLAQRQVLRGRAQLRAVVMELLMQGLTEVHEQLTLFLESPHGLGAVNLSVVLSESSVTGALWGEACTNPEAREFLAHSLGMKGEAEDARLLRSLLAEVHEAAEEFQASRPGREAWARYEELLGRCEDIQVLPVLPGHDTGPMRAELARVGLTPSATFTRSLLVNPLVLAVGLVPDEGTAPQVMVAGLELLELATLVAQLRQLNPNLSNRQVLHLLRQVSTDLKTRKRKALGSAEVEQVQHSARQLLRLQVVQGLRC